MCLTPVTKGTRVKKIFWYVEDISECQTGLVAQLWVAQQFLEEGLSDWLSGVHPQPLGSSVPGHHLTVQILSGLPVGSRCSWSVLFQ